MSVSPEIKAKRVRDLLNGIEHQTVLIINPRNQVISLYVRRLNTRQIGDVRHEFIRAYTPPKGAVWCFFNGVHTAWNDPDEAKAFVATAEEDAQTFAEANMLRYVGVENSGGELGQAPLTQDLKGDTKWTVPSIWTRARSSSSNK